MQDIFPPNNNRPLDEGIKMISRCPVCHYRYNPVEAKVIDNINAAHLLHIKCRSCGSSILALILTNPFGVSSVGLVTDLDSAEVARFKEAAPMTADDTLNVYGALSDGDTLERAVYF